MELEMEQKQFSQMNEVDRIKVFDKITQKALNNYYIHVKQFKFIAEYSNVLYEIDTVDSKKIMLKIANSEDHSRDELVEGLIWLDSLSKMNSIDATRPITTKTDEFITDILIPESINPFYCSLSTWVDGIIVKNNNIDSDYAFKWGKLMATIHKLSLKIDYTKYSHLNEWNKVFYWDKEEIFDNTYSRFFTTKRRKIFQRAIKEIQAGIDRLYDSGQSKMIIHGDLHNENIHLFDNKLYALDFEDAMIGYPVQDIAIALFYVNDLPMYSTLKEAFKKGYTTECEFPEGYDGEIEFFFIG